MIGLRIRRLILISRRCTLAFQLTRAVLAEPYRSIPFTCSSSSKHPARFSMWLNKAITISAISAISGLSTAAAPATFTGDNGAPSCPTQAASSLGLTLNPSSLQPTCLSSDGQGDSFSGQSQNGVECIPIAERTVKVLIWTKGNYLANLANAQARRGELHRIDASANTPSAVCAAFMSITPSIGETKVLQESEVWIVAFFSYSDYVVWQGRLHPDIVTTVLETGDGTPIIDPTIISPGCTATIVAPRTYRRGRPSSKEMDDALAVLRLYGFLVFGGLSVRWGFKWHNHRERNRSQAKHAEYFAREREKYDNATPAKW